jgi:signal transduction histidine kinase
MSDAGTRKHLDAAKRWPLSRIVAVAVLALLLFSVAAVLAGGIALLNLHDNISAVRGHAVAPLNNSATVLDAVFIAVAIGLAVIVVLLALGLRATAIRPLHRLAEQARRVADGDFGHEVSLRGPREVTDLAADVNRMRERILRELSATQSANTVLQNHAEELQRSNAELEQFAYIASHDLQEPLRKVASFSQLLQRRYAGQLDARADQYIEFAVDGAKRMQALINDLLAYSRVGRSAREPALVSSDAALAQARANLAASIEESGATIETGHLPLVLAELPLLTAVFQNLLSNALKFSGEKPPRVVITVSRDEPFWRFSFSDNGIGIDPEYAERIFVIFQRLNERTAYPGTGIGLAMTRKIVEYFGGRIWLDPAFADGARVFFTLPMPPEDLTPEPQEAPEPQETATPWDTPASWETLALRETKAPWGTQAPLDTPEPRKPPEPRKAPEPPEPRKAPEPPEPREPHAPRSTPEPPQTPEPPEDPEDEDADVR